MNPESIKNKLNREWENLNRKDINNFDSSLKIVLPFLKNIFSTLFALFKDANSKMNYAKQKSIKILNENKAAISSKLGNNVRLANHISYFEDNSNVLTSIKLSQNGRIIGTLEMKFDKGMNQIIDAKIVANEKFGVIPLSFQEDVLDAEFEEKK